MTGVRASNALIALTYEKLAQISTATNKEFSNGEVVNFVLVDAEYLVWLCYQMSSIARIPFVFGLCFTLFFIYVGLSFFAGIAVFLLVFVSNSSFGCCLRRIQQRVMACKDDRMQDTNEALNNIKTLKLNSWQYDFYERIKAKRRLELKALRT